MLPFSPLIAMAKPVWPRPNACMLAQAIASKLFRRGAGLFIVWSLPECFLASVCLSWRMREGGWREPQSLLK
ncbi:MAG: hypothetical protein ACPHR0_01485 [Candidatus Puniceispirillaceae bacterium]